MQIKRGWFLILIMLIIASAPASSLKIFPTLTEMGEKYQGEQNYILTVLNDGPRTEDITLTINYESFYLEPYITIEPKRFTLKPNSKKNIQVTTSFPDNLSPEKHLLIVEPMTEFGPGERSIYSFKVPGIPRPDLKISDVKATEAKGSIVFDVVLSNAGNVIARSTPIIEIYNSSNQIGKLEYESKLIILPYTRYNLSLMYDTRDLPPGEYKAKLQFRYNENAMTNLVEKEFSVGARDEGSSYGVLAALSSFKFPIIAAVVILLLFFVFKPEHLRKWMSGGSSPYPKEYRKRFEAVEARMKRLEAETGTLVTETQSFIRESNEWFDKQFGKGAFEFK